MARFRVALTLVLVCTLAFITNPAADSSTQSLPFVQDWTDNGLIVTNDDWSGVPGIIGYRGDGLVSSTGIDPQTVLADGAATPVDVNANQTNPNTFTTGGVSEFHIPDPVVALQGSGTADAPHLVITVSTLGLTNVTVAYNLRDIDGSGDNAVQPVALHYRVGASGPYTNVPAAFVPDATTGPSLATLVTPISVVLPAAADNQPLVQLRILTTDAAGSDEWVGIDDINITGTAVGDPTPPQASGAADPASLESGETTLLTVAVTPGQNPTSTGITVTGDLTPIGGAAAQSFFDDGTNGDVGAGDGTFSFSTTVAGAPGAYSLPATVADAQSRTSLTTIALTILAPPPPPADIVISQVYGGGGNSGATLTHDFIELRNLGTTPVSLGGWSVQYASATGSFWQVTPLSGTIPAGGFYLIQQAAQGGGTTALPTPDAIGTIAMSATNGKVALVAATTALSGTCPLAGAQDFVGFGTANCFEGSGAAPAGSNPTAIIRKGDGYIDTNDNANDFEAGAPTPRNTSGLAPSGAGSASPGLVAPGGTTLLTVTVTPGAFPASTGLTVAGDLTSIGGPASQPFFDDGTNGDAAAGDLVFSYFTTVAPGTSEGTKSIVATIADDQLRSTTVNFSLAVPTPPIPIHQIQGSGFSTPYEGLTVTTTGVVTGVKTSGYFIQTPDADVDADPDTSQGLFVFTGSNTFPAVAMGDSVLVTGTAIEFFQLTELASSPGSFAVIAAAQPLPSPVTLTTGILDPAGSQADLEKFEGMRVHAPSLVTIAPTNSFGEIEAVLSGVPRPMREPGIAASLPIPPDPVSGTVDCCIPIWDENPERIMIDSDALAGMAVVSTTSNVTFANVIGPLDYTFDRYKIAPEAAPSPTSPLMTAVPVPAPAANEFTVGSFNIQNFQGAAIQRTKAARAIRDVMRSPDVIGVIEVSTVAVLQELGDAVNALATGAGEPNPGYTAYLEPASPGATQNVGFLVKSARVQVHGVTQERTDETFVSPSDGLIPLHDRPPFVLRATVDPYGLAPADIIVVVNHPRSFIDIELLSADGEHVRMKRTLQAESIAGLLQELQTDNPGTPVIAVGDYNAFEFNDGYTDPISVIMGMPTPGDEVVVWGSADVVDPNFVNLTDGLPAAERYSYVHDGNAQAIDHVLVNTVAHALVQRYAVARNNADFPATAAYMDDGTRPERNSDHDMPVAYFALPGTPVVVLNGDSPMTVEAYTGSYVEPGATAYDAMGPLMVTVTGAVDVNTPGTYTVSYTASNALHTTTITRTVNVVDTVAPIISGFQLTRTVLWPANHEMIPVSAFYSVTDASYQASCTLSVASSEPANGRGDGNTEVDWIVDGPFDLQLRAERSGNGTGRVYTVTLVCVDPSGNADTAMGTVSVPRSQ